MASPAQVANDMEARAKFWCGRNEKVACVCACAARVIRAFLDGPRPDGRSVTGALTRLSNLEGFCLVRDSVDLSFSIARAAETILNLRQEARQSQ
jgi:hypothetical protein